MNQEREEGRKIMRNRSRKERQAHNNESELLNMLVDLSQQRKF